MTRIILQLELAYRYSRWMEIYPVSSTDRVSLIRKFLYLPRKRLVIWFLLLRCDEKTIVNRNVNLSTRRIFIRRAFQAHYFTSASWRSTLTEPFHDTSIIPYIVHLRIPMNFDILLLVSRDTRSNWSSERTDCADKSRSTRSMMPRRRNPFDLSVAAPRLSSERQDGISMETEIPGCNYFFYGATCRATFSFFSFFFLFFFFFFFYKRSRIEHRGWKKEEKGWAGVFKRAAPVSRFYFNRQTVGSRFFPGAFDFWSSTCRGTKPTKEVSRCLIRLEQPDDHFLRRPVTVQGPKGLETNRERDVRRRLHSWPCDVTRPFFQIFAHNPLTHLTSRLTNQFFHNVRIFVAYRLRSSLFQFFIHSRVNEIRISYF